MAKLPHGTHYVTEDGDFKFSSIPYFVPRDSRQDTYHLFSVNRGGTVSHVYSDSNRVGCLLWKQSLDTPQRRPEDVMEYVIHSIPARGVNCAIEVSY